MKIHLVAGARPNFMKIAPLWRALKADPAFQVELVHTEQHTGVMADAFLKEFELPEPHFRLSDLSAEDVFQYAKPDAVVVAGDVDSAADTARGAVKCSIPVVHLEAGLRSGDLSMPEERNRIAIDHMASLLWTPSHDANANLCAERVHGKIECIGNTMIDTYVYAQTRINADDTVLRIGLAGERYCVVTLHRPSNVDERWRLYGLLAMLGHLQDILQVVFVVHPRTQSRLLEFGFEVPRRVLALTPLCYIRFMNLVSNAALVVTDSGGVQEETTYIGVPCLTLRDNTERPITVTHGTNRLVSPSELLSAAKNTLDTPYSYCIPPLWDGHAAERAVKSLKNHFGITSGEERC